MAQINRATNTAADPSTWQLADAITAAQGGAGQVATPRWPGAIAADEHAAPGDASGPFGTAPDGTTGGTYAADIPWLSYSGDGGIPEPVQAAGDGLPGRPAPNAVPEHDGYGGTAQVMAEHGQDDGSAAYQDRSARGVAFVPRLTNLLTRRMPTDWRKEYDSTGQYVSYTFDRPSLQIQQLSESGELNEHEVGYEAAPIYSRLAQVARQQDRTSSIWAPDGGTPDMTPYQDNTGNPVYEAPPDPQTTTGGAPASGGYGFGDLYG